MLLFPTILRLFFISSFWSFFDSFNIFLPSQNKFIITYQFLYRFYLLLREENFPLVFVLCRYAGNLSYVPFLRIFLKQHTRDESGISPFIKNYSWGWDFIKKSLFVLLRFSSVTFWAVLLTLFTHFQSLL